MNEAPTLDRIKEVFRLDLETGKLYRRFQTCNRKLDLTVEAGAAMKRDGYRRVWIDGHLALSHRLVFAIANDRLPTEQVDHINGDRADNRPSNLRSANGSQNGYNSKLRSNNTSGHKGVVWFKPAKLWRAEISVSGKNKSLGYFHRIEDALAARIEAEQRICGEFARRA